MQHRNRSRRSVEPEEAVSDDVRNALVREKAGLLEFAGYTEAEAVVEAERRVDAIIAAIRAQVLTELVGETDEEGIEKAAHAIFALRHGEPYPTTAWKAVGENTREDHRAMARAARPHLTAKLAAEVADILKAVSEVCLPEDAVEGESRFVCLGETGDPIIEADTPAEVLRQLSAAFAEYQGRMETEVSELTGSLTRNEEILAAYRQTNTGITERLTTAEAANAQLREANARLVTDGAWIAGEVAALRPLVECVRSWQEARKAASELVKLWPNSPTSTLGERAVWDKQYEKATDRVDVARDALSALALPEEKIK